MRTLIAATLTAVLAGPVVTTSAAHAEDQRPCVSKVESKVHHRGDARRTVERLWDVTGRGGDGIMAGLLDPGFNTYIVDYPACGYSDTEAGVAVFYREDDDTVRFVMRYWSTTSTMHGHPRPVRCC